MESPANILEDLDAASEIPADIMASPTAASTAELALENEGQNECDDEPHFEELLSDSEADEVFKEQGDTLLIGEYNGLNNNEELNDESDGSVHIDDSEVEVLEEVSRIGPGLAYNREELAIELDSEEDIDNLESEAEGSTYREATNDELDGDEDLINKYSRSKGEVSSVQDDGAYAGAEDLPLSIVDIEDGSCSSPPDALEGRNGIAGDAEIAGETEIADDYIDEASENSADDVDQEIDNGIGWESDSDIDPEIENDIAKESDSDTDQEGDGHVDPQGCNDIDDEIDKGSDQEREVAGDDAGERSGFDSEDYARWEASGDDTKGPTVDSSDESVGGSQEPRVSLAQLDIPLVVQVDESRYLLQFQGKAPGCSLHGLKPLEHPSGTCGSVQQFLGFLLRLDEMQHGHGTAFLEVPELGLRMGQHSVHALQMDVEEILWCYQALLQNTAHGKHTHMLIRVSKGMDLGHQYELVRTLAKAGRGMDALETAMRKRRGGRLTAGPGPKKSRVGNEQTPPGTGIR